TSCLRSGRARPRIRQHRIASASSPRPAFMQSTVLEDAVIIHLHPVPPRRPRRSALLPIVAGLVACIALAAGTPAAAQSTLGTIRGTVNDAQGGVIPGASVIATDEDTGVARETVSDGEGLYELSNLRPGTYAV